MAAIGAVSYFECRMCAPPLGVTKPTKGQILQHLEFEDGIERSELEDNPELYYNEIFVDDLNLKPKLKRRRDDAYDSEDERKAVKRISGWSLRARRAMLGMGCKR